jgi:hypothetical protein
VRTILGRLRQCLLNVFDHRVRRSGRSIAFDDTSLAVDQKLCEIPLDAVGEGSRLLLFQEFVQRMSIVTVDFDFGVQVGLEFELGGQEFLDFGIAGRLLE